MLSSLRSFSEYGCSRTGSTQRGPPTHSLPDRLPTLAWKRNDLHAHRLASRKPHGHRCGRELQCVPHFKLSMLVALLALTSLRRKSLEATVTPTRHGDPAFSCLLFFALLRSLFWWVRRVRGQKSGGSRTCAALSLPLARLLAG